MRRLDINRSAELEVFVRVVEEGSLSRAAQACGLSPSAVSKLLSRLEARLGARLLARSTRKLQLTAEGRTFYERGSRILNDLDEAERIAASGDVAAGPVRVNTSVPFATHVLSPLVAEFLERHPRVSLQIVQTDEVVDLLEERTDLAIRAGPLKSSSLIARKLGETGFTLVAAPAYLAQHGTPTTVGDLERHIKLGFCYRRAIDGWPFEVQGERTLVPTGQRVQSSDGEGLRRLALDGAGIARLANFMIQQDLAQGRLIPLLEEFNAGDVEVIHAVYVGGGPLPARVRAVIDFLAEKVRLAAEGFKRGKMAPRPDSTGARPINSRLLYLC